jgi:hypothetical protein
LVEEAQRHMPAGNEITKGNISYYCRAQNAPNGMRLLAISKALKIPADTLMPPVKAMFNMQTVDVPLSANFTGDEAHLRINMKVPADIAMEVMRLLRPLRDQKAADAGE